MVLDKTDQELMGDFQQGDDLAFVMLYNRHKRNLVFFCSRVLQDHDAAEDIAQQAFLKVYLQRSKLHADGNFTSFLFTVARNLCLNRLRDQKKNIRIAEEICSANEFVINENTTAIENNEILSRALAQLNADYRELVLLRDYEGFSYREISEITRLSESAIKAKLFKARLKLRDMLLPILKDGA